LTLLLAIGSPHPNWTAWSGLSGEDALLLRLDVPGQVGTLGFFPLLKRREQGNGRRVCEVYLEGEGKGLQSGCKVKNINKLNKGRKEEKRKKEGREGKGREGKGREGKGREGKGREGKGRE